MEVAFFEAGFSSLYIARKSPSSHAWAKRPAASFSGEPGAPCTAPATKATEAMIARGSVRVTRRRRRSTSGERLFTAQNVAVGRSPGARTRVDLVADLAEGRPDGLVGDREAARMAVGRGREDGAEDAALGVDDRAARVAAANRAAQGADRAPDRPEAVGVLADHVAGFP